MVQQVQELINKIKTEGIKEAEKKAQDISGEAQKKADEIIKNADEKAKQIIASAQADQKRLEESTHKALQQAARDMLLNLRKEIEATLKRITSSEMKQALTPECLSELISDISKAALASDEEVGGIIVTMNKDDIDKLKKGFIKKLEAELKKPIEFFAKEDISAGFTISFDEGKSAYDFSERNLGEYLGNFLNEELSSLLKEVTTE